LDNGRYVGQSDLANENQDREHLGTGYTGVHPDYRRRGIATVLKARCIQCAQELGVKTIATGNDSANPMYQLNLQLGFKPVPGDLLYEMRLA
jgi:GNAT superfamily N-acetyltransferase